MHTRVNGFQYLQPFPHKVSVSLRSEGGEFVNSVNYERNTLTVLDIVQAVRHIADDAVQDGRDVLIFIHGSDTQLYRVV